MLALLFVARTGLGYQFQTLGSVADQLVTELGFDFTEIGTLVGLFMLPGLLLALPAGLAGRYFSDRALVGWGLLALAAGGGLAALANGFDMLAWGRIACGVGFIVSSIFFAKMVADWFAGKELATAMGMLVMSWPFGIAMGQVSQGWVALVYDWRTVFAVASIYRLIGAALVVLFYRRPEQEQAVPVAVPFGLSRRELGLTVVAALVWGFFNAAYIVYLGFAPRILVQGGFGQVEALSIISLASWVMIFSAAICGQISDRSGKPDLILYVCMGVAVAVFALLPLIEFAVPLSLVFGLIGAAPAGVIMALTVEAMVAEKRAFGMAVFISIAALMMAAAPGIAGWLFDQSGDPYWPILFGAALLVLTAASNVAFRALQRKFPLVENGA